MLIKKNDKIKLHINAMTSEGSGIGRYKPDADSDKDGLAVFVRGTVPGDDIIAHIIKVSRNYAVGIIDELLSPSSQRIESECPYSKQCGGCSFWQMTYDEELKYKLQRVNDAVSRVGKIDFECDKILPADDIKHYRNKAEYPVRIVNGTLTAGFYAYKSHRVIPVRDCLLQPPEFQAGIDAIAGWAKVSGVTSFDEQTGRGLLRHIYLRKAAGTGEIAVCLVINGRGVPNEKLLIDEILTALPAVKSISVNINRERTNVILGDETRILWGNEKICDTLTPKTDSNDRTYKFMISPQSFYQVNHDQCEKLYGLVREFASLDGSETVLDLYCGAGTIGLTLADCCKKVYGVEIVPSAIENANANARLNNIENAQFLCADAFEGAFLLEQRGEKIDLLVLDPPRKGCSRDLLDLILSLSIPKIVYVSCDSATLARDMSFLSLGGYKISRMTAVDMFPRTPHVETVVLLRRGNILVDGERNVSRWTIG